MVKAQGCTKGIVRYSAGASHCACRQEFTSRHYIPPQPKEPGSTHRTDKLSCLAKSVCSLHKPMFSLGVNLWGFMPVELGLKLKQNLGGCSGDMYPSFSSSWFASWLWQGRRPPRAPQDQPGRALEDTNLTPPHLYYFPSVLRAL